ncbi:hypothetical protein F4811DRAFT_507390 [Daldinia bambusicola]|nr:hypothetical protein F4811DRAFT_507390 [Daldinia bambusicola]
MIERLHAKEGVRETERKKKKKTYNTGDSLVVTDPTTNPAVSGLSKGRADGIPSSPDPMAVRDNSFRFISRLPMRGFHASRCFAVEFYSQ